MGLCITRHKIPYFHVISRCGNCLFTKFRHQEIRWNLGILRSVKNKQQCRLLFIRKTNIQSVTVSREQLLNHDASFEQWQRDKSLIEKLKVSRKDNFDPIPPQLLRKYIQYARKYVQPKLSSEAAKILQVRIDWKLFHILGKKEEYLQPEVNFV